jgi:ABC-type branched-subunit amino acid transport system substrate-binding protein
MTNRANIQPSRCRNQLRRSGPLLLVCWLAAAVMRVSGAEAPAASTNIVIGLLVPPGETFGASIRDGAQIAVDQANRTDGKKVRLVVRGRVGQWGADAEEAARMVLDDGATALITPPDGAASHLVLQVSGRTTVPVVSLCPDSSVSRAGVPWFARVVPRTTDQARALFSHFSNGSSPVRRWLALVPPGRPGREVSIDLKTAALLSGCFLEQTIEIMATNADTRVTQALSTNTAGILVWLDPKPAALCVKALQRAGFSGAVAGPVWLHAPEFVALAGNSLEGFVLPGLLLGEASQQRFNAFEIVFRDKFKHQPDIMAAFGFDAAALLVQLLRSTEPENLPRSFPLDFTLPGVTGLLNFDAEGNRKTALQLLVFARDGFVPLR